MVGGPNVHGGENMNGDTESMLQVNLTGKIAVIIGGTGSIGQAIAISFARSGATVIVAGRSKPRKDSELMLECKKNKNISFLPVNVLEESSVRDLADRITDKYKRVDILVLAQGQQIRKPFHNLTLEEWNSVISTNLTGTFLVCKHFAKLMMKNKYGKIIGITSLTSMFGIRNISSYAASKGGMQQFLKTLALELAAYNINVNMIAPGRIKTRMTKDIFQDQNLKKSTLRCIPMKRFGLPSDLIGAVFFLASDMSNYMTGQTIVIDGGWLACMGNPIS